LIYGTNSDPIYEYETNILKPEIKKMYEKVISKNESRNSTKEIRNIYNKLKANNFIKITEEEEVAKTNTNTNTSQNSNVHSSDNNWVIGVWEVQTDAGLMNLTILDSQNATFLGDRGKYTIDNGVLNWRDKYGIVSPFKLNYSNQTIDGGGGYVLRKRNVSSNNSQTSRSSSNQSTKSYNRTYRDYFESESAIHEFLSNHTFVSSDGSKLTYSIGELIIKFPSSRLQLINPNILSYNQDRAIIRLMSTQANVSIKFTIDASNGTITDGQTVYRAIN
jgi:hypothetical protein